jgi:hypothetical protein
MAVGDITCTLVGSYDTVALAVAAINGGNLPAATDYYQIILEPGIGTSRLKVIKVVRATA